MSRAMQVGDIGLDAAFPPTSYAQMAKDGARFFLRYSKGEGGASNSISTKPGEIGQALAVGDFIGNFELGEGTPEEGAASGRKHGNADRDFWLKRGYAPGAGVIVSWETSDNRAKYAAVGQFIEAYASAVGRPPGLYGPLNALVFFRDRGLIDLTWLPMSSALSGINTNDAHGFPLPQSQYAAVMEKAGKDHGINLVQNRNRWYGVAADENKYVTALTKPFSHLQALGGIVSATGPEKWDAKDWAAFDNHVWDFRVVAEDKKDVHSAAYWLQHTPFAQIPAIQAQLKAMSGTEIAQSAALVALAQNSSITPDQLKAIVQDAVKNSVVAVDVNVHDSTGGAP